MRRFGFIAAAAAATVPAVMGTAAAQGSDAPVRLGVGPVDQSTPLAYAAEAGLYKKYGVNVELVKLPSGNALAAAVAGGSLELAMSSSLAAIIAISRGIPFTIIANLGSYDSARPDAAMIVLKDSPIRTPKDLEGKTLAEVSLQDLNSLATYGWLDGLGVDRSTIKYIELPASATLSAMEQGRVAASAIYEPFYSAYLATGKVRVIGYPYDGVAKRFSSALVYGSKAWVDGHRDVVERFLRALAEASAYISAHESESAGVIGRLTGLDTTGLSNIHHPSRTVVLNATDLQPVIDAAIKYKVIQSSVPANEMICSCAPRR